MGDGPLLDRAGGAVDLGQGPQVLHPALEPGVVRLDLLGQVGQVHLDGRLHVGVLVLGVGRRAG